MVLPEPDFDSTNRLCADCVGESYLKELIRTGGIQAFCSYCDEESATLSIEEVADLVERAFDEHYERTATEPDGYEYAMDHGEGWEREGELAKWAILNAAIVSEGVAIDILAVLTDRHSDFDSHAMGQECPFAKESHYVEKDAGHGEFLILWRDFERGIKTQSRFFSPSAKSILDQIFSGISDLRTTQGESVVVTAGPGTTIPHLYRARVFAGEDGKLEKALKAPWKHLGTPPAEAAGAGRMNARGIAVFYGARDAETALSEVRPPVGGKVAIAIFRIARPLRLLNLTALRSVAAGGSIFNPATLVQMQRGNFLEELSHLMSRAVMPHEEVSEYLPTQAVADYLENVARLDGIIFPSVQTGQQSSNVVLFHRSARVEDVIVPKGTVVDVQLETGDSDGIYPDYIVWEKVPPPTTQGESSGPVAHWGQGLLLSPHGMPDFRAVTLHIELDTIQVHHVAAVTFTAQSHVVSRHRFEQAVAPPWASAPDAAVPDEDIDNPFA